MALVRTRAIVIREQPYQDHDKILTLFTAKEGKQKAIAKGARRRRSGMGVATQLFSYSDFVYYPGKNFANINEATLVEAFYPLRGDVFKMTLGSYLLELIDAFYDYYQGDPRILKLLTHALYYMSENKAENDEVLAAAFAVKLTRSQGIGPVLSEDDAFYASLDACDQDMLTTMVKNSFKGLCSADWPAAQVTQLLDKIVRHVTAFMERASNSYTFYKTLKQDPAKPPEKR